MRATAVFEYGDVIRTGLKGLQIIVICPQMTAVNCAAL